MKTNGIKQKEINQKEIKYLGEMENKLTNTL